VIADLPVGQYLQNHQGVFLGPFSTNDSSKFLSVSNNLTEGLFEQYVNLKEDGVLSRTEQDVQGFFVSPQANAAGEGLWPDIHLILTSINRFDLSGPNPPNQFWINLGATRQELNKDILGYIALNTTAYKIGIRDNTELAIIDFKFLTSSRDYDVLISGNIHIMLPEVKNTLIY